MSTAQSGMGFFLIDDSSALQAGSPAAVQLSTGWTTQVRGGPAPLLTATASSTIEPLLDRFYNQSVTWTTASGASLSLSFTGTSIYAYGLAGPDGPSTFSVSVDGRDMGRYTAQSATVDPRHLLFAAHNLPAGKHVVTFVNRQEGILAFDYANVTGIQPDTTGVSPSTATSSGSASVPAISTGVQSSTTSTATAGMATAASLAAATDPSALRAPYVFQWNAAARFVVVLACLMAVGVLALLYFYVMRRHWLARRRQSPAAKVPASARRNASGGRARPTSKVLSALKGRKIGYPVPSDDGESVRSVRTSESPVDSAVPAKYEQPTVTCSGVNESSNRV